MKNGVIHDHDSAFTKLVGSVQESSICPTTLFLPTDDPVHPACKGRRPNGPCGDIQADRQAVALTAMHLVSRIVALKRLGQSGVTA